MSKSQNPVAYERAAFLRDAEYTKEEVVSSDIQDAILSANSKFKVSPNYCDDCDDEEICDTIEKIPTDDSQREEEIQKIVDSDEDLELDDIMDLNLEKESEEYEDE